MVLAHLGAHRQNRLHVRIGELGQRGQNLFRGGVYVDAGRQIAFLEDRGVLEQLGQEFAADAGIAERALINHGRILLGVLAGDRHLGAG